MKKLLVVVCIVSLIGCQTNESEIEKVGDEVQLKFELDGLVDSEDVPFGGRVENNDDYTVYGIQVESVTSNTGNGELSSQPYAMGVFDDLTDLSITLIDGNEYWVQATAFQKGTAYGLAQSYDDVAGVTYFESPLNRSLENEFLYSTESTPNFDSNSTTYYSNADSSSVAFSFRPEITRYISSKVVFVAEEGLEVSVEMIRANFGIQIYSEDLNEGSIRVKVAEIEGEFMLSPSVTETDARIYQFSNFTDLLTDLANYEESMNMNVIYDLEVDGVQVSTPVFSDDVNFKKDFIKRIFITAPDLSEGNRGDLTITMEDVEMQYDSLSID